MKHETKVKDINTLIAANKAEKRAAMLRNAAKAAAELQSLRSGGMGS
jgi:hypothetical protein